MSAWLSRHARALLAALAVLLAGALYLLDQAADFDGRRYQASVALLQQARQQGAQWEVEVLKARLGLSANYDAVVDPLALLTALPQRLTALAAPGQADVAALGAALADYQRALQDKSALVEAFKSHNAVLRNSLAFLPAAAEEAGGGSRGARVNGPLALAIGQSLLDTLHALNASGPADAGGLQSQLDSLQDWDGPLAPEQRARLAVFVSHARTVLRERAAVNALLQQIAAVPLAHSMDAIQGLLQAQEQRAAAASEDEARWLAVLAATLALVLGYGAVQLVRSYAVIGRVNHQLKHANEHLEQRVQQRTGELTAANARLREEIAERKLLQCRLVQSEKLASVGQLAAGMAHEINNPLAYLTSNFSILEHYVGQLFGLLDQEGAGGRRPDPAAPVDLAFLREDIPSLLRESRGGMERVARVVQNLKDFSRTDSAHPWEQADLHECLAATLSLLGRQLDGVADLVCDYSPLPAIECQPRQLNQVIMNLLLNAAQAMGPQRGRITLRTGAAAGQVWLEVVDDGCGIGAEVLPRIFDPFFTTRAIGHGAGLGLSLSYGVVQAHHGRIDVQSAPGQGSTFRVLLPVRQPAPAITAGIAPAAHPVDTFVQI